MSPHYQKKDTNLLFVFVLVLLPNAIRLVRDFDSQPPPAVSGNIGIFRTTPRRHNDACVIGVGLSIVADQQLYQASSVSLYECKWDGQSVGCASAREVDRSLYS
ncbi:hypothetical protein CBL_03232 [Carabus blaptoides fortunei]